MATNTFTGDDDLIVNSAARLPVCLCLDCSGSMNKNDAIDQLNKGVGAFYEAIKNNEQAKISCEIAVVTFNGEVTVVDDFGLVETKQVPQFTAEGGTAMAHAVEKCLSLLEERKADYKRNGVEYFQPWLVLITDGKPGDKEDMPAVTEKTRQLIEDKKLTLFPIAVGSDDDEVKFREIMDVLNSFTPKPKALHLRNLKFQEFFEWLGKSVVDLSQSTVGEKIKLDTSTILDDWGEI